MPDDDPTRSGSGLSGLLGNFGADVRDMVGGLYSMAFEIPKELISNPVGSAESLLTLGMPLLPHTGPPTPVISSLMPVGMASMLGKQWKSFYLDRDVFHHMYEHPLQPLLDATLVAGVAGGAGRMAAAGEGLAGGIGRGAMEAAAGESLARGALTGLPRVSYAIGRAMGPGFGEWVASNAGKLEAWRASGMAGEVPGGLEAGQVVKLSETVGESSALARAPEAVQTIANAGYSGIETIGQVAKRWATMSPSERWVRFLDVTNPERIRIAEPMTGFTKDIVGTQNPLMRVAGNAYRRRFTEPIVEFEMRFKELQDLAEVGQLDAAGIDRMAQMGRALSRMRAGRAQYVAKPMYGVMHPTMTRAVNKFLSGMMQDTMLMRREMQGKLVGIFKESGADPSFIENDLHNILKGLDDGRLADMPDSVLGEQLAAKGFGADGTDPMVAAAQDMVHKTGGFQSLTIDEQNALLRKVTDGSITVDDLWTYKPDADLLDLPERGRVLEQLYATTDELGIPRRHADFLMGMFWDSGAKAIARNNARYAGDINAVFADQALRFEEMWTTIDRELLQNPRRVAMLREPAATRAAYEAAHRENVAAGLTNLTKERLPLEPMLKWIDETGPTVEPKLAATIERARFRGEDISVATADEWAGRFGVHPSEIWGDAYYGEVAPTAGLFSTPKIFRSLMREEQLDTFVEQIRAELNRTLPPDEVPYTAEFTKQILWDRTKEFLVEERAKLETRLAGAKAKDRLAAAGVLGTLDQLISEELSAAEVSAAWGRLTRTGWGRQVQNGLRAMLATPSELAQEVSGIVRGSTIFGPSFKTMVRVFRSADITTYVHEYGHVLRQMMAPEDAEAIWDIYRVRAHPGKSVEEVFAEAGDELFQIRRNMAETGEAMGAGYRRTKYPTTAGGFASVDTPAGEIHEGQFVTLADDATPRRIVSIDQKRGRYYAQLDSGQADVPVEDLAPVPSVEPWERGLAEPLGMPKVGKDIGRGRSREFERRTLTGARYERYVGADRTLNVGDKVEYQGKSMEVLQISAAPVIDSTGGVYKVDMRPTVRLPDERIEEVTIAGYRKQVQRQTWVYADELAGPPVPQPRPEVGGEIQAAPVYHPYTPRAVTGRMEPVGVDPVAKDVANRFTMTEEAAAKQAGTLHTVGESPGYYLMKQDPTTPTARERYFIVDKAAMEDAGANAEVVVYHTEEMPNAFVEKRSEAGPPDAGRWAKPGAKSLTGETAKIRKPAPKPPEPAPAPEVPAAAVSDIIQESEVPAKLQEKLDARLMQAGGEAGDPLEAGTVAYENAQEAGIYVTQPETFYEAPAELPLGSRVAFYGEGVNRAEVGTVVELDPRKITIGNQIRRTKLAPFAELTPADYQTLPVVYKEGDLNIAVEGNHRIYRARQLGEEKLKVVYVDGEHHLRDQVDVMPKVYETADEAMTPTDPIARAQALSEQLHPEYDTMTPEELRAAYAGPKGEAGAPKARPAKVQKVAPEAVAGAKNLEDIAAAKAAAPDIEAGVQDRVDVLREMGMEVSDADIAGIRAGLEQKAAPPAEVAAPVAAAPGGAPPELPPGGAPPGPPMLPGRRGWTRQMEEAFAEDLERWFTKGLQPSDRRVIPAFRVMAEHLMDVWRKLRGYILDNDLIPKESQELFDRYLGDGWRIFDQTADTPVPGAIYKGRRRVRDLPVENLAATWGDGRAVMQVVDELGKPLSAQEIRARAVRDAASTEPKLQAAFGKNVVVGLKDLGSIRKYLDDGLRVTDALRSRIRVGSWREIETTLAQIQGAGFDILGVDDLRARAATGGKRGVTAYVVDQATPDLVQEIEIGTPLYDTFRNATYRHDQALSHLDVEYAKVQDSIARLSQSTNANQAGVQKAIADQQRALEYLTIQREAGRRYMEGFYEMLTDEIARDYGLPVPKTTERDLVNQLRLWNAMYDETPMFESGRARFDKLFERVYLPQRLRSGAEWDETSGMWLGGKSAYVLDDERAAAGLPMPVYFPDMKEFSLLDFVVPKVTKGARKIAENKSMRRNRGLLYDAEEFITDPVTAYSARAARGLKYQDVYDMITFASKTFGRKIASPEHLLPGEAILAPDYVLAFFKAKIGLEDRLGSLLSKMDRTELVGAVNELTAKTGKAMAPDILAEGIRRALNVDDMEAGGLYLAITEALPKTMRELVGVKMSDELYAIPKVVERALNEQVRYSMGPKVRLAWDKPMQLWRSLTLYGRPAWVMNNLMGNISFSAIEGTRLRDVVRYATDRHYRWYVRELVKQAEGTTPVAGIDQGWMASLEAWPTQYGVAAENLAGHYMQLMERKVSTSRAMVPFHRWADAIKHLNTNLENAFRETAFVEGLRRAGNEALDLPALRGAAKNFWGSKEELQDMMIKGITPADARRAQSYMERTFGDYSNLSPFERNVWRRFVMPFWGFYRHIGQIVLRMPFEHPFKARALYGLTQLDQEMRKDWNLPEWMDGMVPFGAMNPDGTQRFLSTSGPNPFNAFADMGLSLFSPQIKAVYEMATGRDAFTGRPFTDPNVIVPYGSDTGYRIVRDESGKPVDAVPVNKVTPPIGVELLSQIPQYDMIRQAVAGGKPWDTEGIIGSIGNPMRDSQGNVVSPYSPVQALGKWLGVSTYTYDVAGYQQRAADEKAQALKMAYDRWVKTNVGSPTGSLLPTLPALTGG